MVIYLGDTPIAGVAKPVEPTRNVGQIIQSLVPLTDAGLHLLDGALISGSGIYSDFVTYMADLVSTYPNLFVTEANWQQSVATYGVCGKFVCTPNFYAWDDGNGGIYYTISDTPEVGDHVYGSTSIEDIEVLEVLSVGTNTIEIGLSGLSGETYTRASASDSYGSVRLPKITGIIEGTVDATALGDLVEAGLPNITGILPGIRRMDTFHDASLMNKALHWQYGNFSQTSMTQSVTGDVDFDPILDASVENPIYGNSTTVQPQTIKAFIYIVIATSAKTEIQVDIDEIATDLNGKVDTDLSNITTVSTQITTTATNPFVNKLTNADITVAPSSNIETGLKFRDNNNNGLGGFNAVRFANGIQCTTMTAKNKISGTEKTAYFDVFVNSNGDDLADASAGAKSTIVNWSMPKTGAGTLLFTPANNMNGVNFVPSSTKNGYLHVTVNNNASGNHIIYVKNISNGLQTTSYGQAGFVLEAFVPVAKGQTCQFYYYDVGGTGTYSVYFHEAIGG